MVAHESGKALKKLGYLEGQRVDVEKMEIVKEVESDSDVQDPMEDQEHLMKLETEKVHHNSIKEVNRVVEVDKKETIKKKEMRTKIDEELARTNSELAYKNVIFPEYAMNRHLNVPEESAPPPIQRFYGLGYDRSPADQIRHY